MSRALRHFESRSIDLVLLFAEDPDLYRRFGFNIVPQYAFTGPAPAAAEALASRTLHVAVDTALIDDLLSRRAPLSDRIALTEAPALFLEKIRSDDTLKLTFVPGLDALIVHEEADDMLILLDVVAADMPPLARILGAFQRRFARVTTQFPPDRLAWAEARPIAEDTGLMVRGPWPDAMRQPFMLPPTAEF